MKYLRKSRAMVSSRQQIELRDIDQDGVAYFADRAVLILRVSALNLALMSEDRQQALLDTYKELLDSLDSPCQILIRIRQQSFQRGLFGKLSDNRPPAATRQSVVTREAYLIVSQLFLDKSLSAAAWRLRLRVSSLQDTLSKMGLSAAVLSQSSVAKLYFKALNPRVKQCETPDFELPSDQAMNESIDWPQILTYDSLREERSYLKIDGIYLQTLVVEGYPAQIDLASLSNLVNYQDDIDISYQLRPIDGVLALEKLNRKIAELESQKRHQFNRGQLMTPEISDPLEDALDLRQRLMRSQETLHQVSLFLTVFAETLPRLQAASQRVTQLLAGKLFKVSGAGFCQLPAYQGSLPQVADVLPKSRRNFDTSSLSYTFPFHSLELVDDKGLFYGLNKVNESLIVLDRFALPNANAVICGQSGSGKSYLAKLEILRARAAGLPVIVLDPENEYRALVEHLGGRYLTIGSQDSCGLNPLHLNNHSKVDIADRIPTLLQIIDFMVEGLSVEEKAVLDKVLLNIYKTRRQPDLKDLTVGLKEYEQTDLSLRLEKFASGSLSHLFAGSKSLDLCQPLVAFNLQTVSTPLKPLVMMIIANLVYEDVLFRPHQRLLYIDETWLLLQHRSTREFLDALVRRARKYYLGVTLISQQLGDFCRRRQATALLSQASLKVFLRQDSSQLPDLRRHLDCSAFEERFLMMAGVGEALLVADNLHVLLKVLAHPGEHPLVSSHPREQHGEGSVG